MILREATIKYKDYDPEDLSKGSNKRVCVSCDECGRVRWMIYQSYIKYNHDGIDLCVSCSRKGEKAPMYGKHHSEETKQKNREAHLGKKLSKEHKDKISKSLIGNTRTLGYKHTDETRQKMRDSSQHISGKDHPNYGKIGELSSTFGLKHSEKSKEKQSKAMLGRYTGDKNPNWKGGFSYDRSHVLPINKCICLNEKFVGSEGHHIMSNVIIYIPKYIHRSIWHSMKEGYKNMNEINKLALQFLNGEYYEIEKNRKNYSS